MTWKSSPLFVDNASSDIFCIRKCFGRTHMGSVALIGMLDRVTMSAGRAMLSSKRAFMAGSSKHGKASLACVGSNCVAAIHLEEHSTTMRNHRQFSWSGCSKEAEPCVDSTAPALNYTKISKKICKVCGEKSVLVIKFVFCLLRLRTETHHVHA